MIQLKNVTKCYDGARRALDDCTFAVEKGEFVFLTGPGGCGKSTVLKLLCMEEFPTSGSLTVCGFDSAHIRPKQIPDLRRKLGIEFPEFGLLDDRTVYENAGLALRAAGAREKTVSPRIFELLAATDLAHKAALNPHALSGSEQLRLRIARALANDPWVLLADDPFAGLDAAAAIAIYGLFKSINLRGTTVLIASHSSTFVSTCPQRKIVLEQGRLVQ